MLYGDTYIICMIICLVYIIIWPLMGQLRSWAARMASIYDHQGQTRTRTSPHYMYDVSYLTYLF